MEQSNKDKTIVLENEGSTQVTSEGKLVYAYEGDENIPPFRYEIIGFNKDDNPIIKERQCKP